MQLPRGHCRNGFAIARRAAEKALEAVGTVLYVGYVPAVSGTVASVPGVLLFWMYRGRVLPFSILAIALFVVGSFAARHLARKTQDADPKCVVIDELVGMMAAVALLEWSWTTAIGAFVTFRFFDIVKPFPARALEQIGGGLGIMLDDIVAAAYTCVIVRLTVALLSG